MPAGEYVVGALLFAGMLLGVAWGTALIARKRLPGLVGAQRVTALGLVGALGVLAVNLVPGMLGLLSRPAVLVATGVWLVAAYAVPAVAYSGPSPPPAPVRESGPAATALAAVAAVATILLGLVLLRNELISAPPGVDAMNFHLPGVGAWIQSGSIWHIDQYLPDLAPGHYPNNGDVYLMAAILPWDNDWLAQLVTFPFWALLGVATYSLAQELRAPRAAAVTAACLLLTVPSVSLVAADGAFVDTVMLFGFASGLLFLVRHWRTGDTSDLVLAGLALGLSFGTKWYAVSAVPIVVFVWAAGSLIARRGVGTVLRQGGALVGLIALAGGVWMLRNLIQSANPVFPVRVAPGGVTIFDAPPDRIRELAGWTIAHYFGEPRVWWDTILPQYRDALALPAAFALATAAGAAAFLGTRRGTDRPPETGLIAAAVACTALLVGTYVITPYTAGGPEGMPVLTGADARYIVPALVVAVVLGAWLAGRVRRGPLIFGLAGLVAVGHGILETKQGLHSGATKEQAATVVVGLVLLGVMALAIAPRLLKLQGRAERRALAVLGGLAVVVLIAGGSEIEDRYTAKRYANLDPVADMLLSSDREQRVGIDGTWPDEIPTPPLLAFGPRYENRVDYIGRNDQELERRYRTRAGFQAALRRGRYDLILIGRGRPPAPTVASERWAQQAGYRVLARGRAITLMGKERG